MTSRHRLGLDRPMTCVIVLLAFSMASLPLQAQSAQPSFEVATVKAAPHADPSTGSWSPPNTGRFNATHLTLTRLIQLAYNVDASQIADKPSWLDSNLYDIAAKPEDGVKLSREELRPRLQNLLRERFHLVAHTELRNSRGYALVEGKDAPNLTPTKGDHFPGFRIDVSPGHMNGVNWSLPQLAQYLTAAIGFPVVDETGIAGSYDIGFSYEPSPDAEGPLPSLPAALKSATGLILKSKNVPTQTVVIDSVNQVPTLN